MEKYIENAANQRKWCKKETGKNLGNIDKKCMNRLKTHEEDIDDIETAGTHDNNQRKSCKIHWKMLERYSEGKCDNNLAGKFDNNQNKGCKICWNMEETGATARNKL